MQRIIRSKLAQSVAEQMIELLGQGRYGPGDRLPTEREMMDRLGVGRSSIREGLQALQLMGLIDIQVGRGTFVRRVDSEVMVNPHLLARLMEKETTRELLEARRLLEPAIAALAAQRATAEDLAEVERLLHRIEELMHRGEPTYQASATFHHRLAQAAKNAVLIRFMESIMSLMAHRGEQIEHDGDFLKWELASHWEVFRAVRSRDPEQAAEVMRQHLVESAEAYLRITQADGEVPAAGTGGIE